MDCIIVYTSKTRRFLWVDVATVAETDDLFVRCAMEVQRILDANNPKIKKGAYPFSAGTAVEEGISFALDATEPEIIPTTNSKLADAVSAFTDSIFHLNQLL